MVVGLIHGLVGGHLQGLVGLLWLDRGAKYLVEVKEVLVIVQSRFLYPFGGRGRQWLRLWIWIG